MYEMLRGSAQYLHESCTGTREDPAKIMAHSRMALSKRSLGAQPASSKSDAARAHAGWQASRRVSRRSAGLSVAAHLLSPRKLRRTGSTCPQLEPKLCSRASCVLTRAPRSKSRSPSRSLSTERQHTLDKSTVILYGKLKTLPK